MPFAVRMCRPHLVSSKHIVLKWNPGTVQLNCSSVVCVGQIRIDAQRDELNWSQTGRLRGLLDLCGT